MTIVRHERDRLKMSFGTEYCAGFVDVHGQWNNGFYCPTWGDPNVPYCCGDEHERYCCSQHPHQREQQHRQHRYHHQQPLYPATDGQLLDLTAASTDVTSGPFYYHILLVGFVVGTLVLMTSAAVIMCYYCRCCLVYRHRKRRHNRPTNAATSRHLANGSRIAADVGYQLCVGRTGNRHPRELIPLRPPSYHTIEDPPPYPDDDADDCALTTSCDKRPHRLLADAGQTNRALSVPRHHTDELQLSDAVRQSRDAVNDHQRTDDLTSAFGPRRLLDGSLARDTGSSTRRMVDVDAATNNDDSLDRLRQRDRQAASHWGRTAVHSSPRPSDWSLGVPYSITCPSRFDRCLLDAATSSSGRSVPLAHQMPRSSASGDPVDVADAVLPITSGMHVYRPESRQTSSVFEISSYIIAKSASNTSV